MSYRDNGYVPRVGYNQQFTRAAAGPSFLDDMVAYWPMDETGAGTRYDAVGSADLIVVGSGTEVAEVAGVQNNAVNVTFPGKYLMMNPPTVYTFSPPGSDYTAAAYVNVRSTLSPTRIFSTQGSGMPFTYWQVTGSSGVGDKMYCEIMVDSFMGYIWESNINYTGALTVGSWVLSIVRIENGVGGEMRAYGLPSNNGTDYPFTQIDGPWNGAHLQFGGSILGNTYVDEMMLWNRYLTDEECDELGTLYEL